MSDGAPLPAIRRWTHATAVFRIGGASPSDGPWPASVMMNGRRLRVEVQWQNRLISYMGALDGGGVYRLRIDDPPSGTAALKANDPDASSELEGGWNKGGGNRGSWTVRLKAPAR